MPHLADLQINHEQYLACVFVALINGRFLETIAAFDLGRQFGSMSAHVIHSAPVEYFHQSN